MSTARPARTGSNRRVRLAALVPLLALAGACGTQADSAPGDGGTLVVAISASPKVLNTNYTYDGQAYYINSNIYSKLVRYDEVHDKLYGDLAESWTSTPDATTYTFTLRKGVKWTDGTDFSARDVVWTFSDILKTGKAAFTYNTYANLDSVTSPDPATVVFKLKQPSSIFLYQLADYYGANILPEHVYASGDPAANPANTAPVGTGPFKFASAAAGESVTLERNDTYYGHKATIKKLVFRVIPNRNTAISALQTGEIQYSTVSPEFGQVPNLQKVPSIKLEKTESNIMQWFAFNLRNPILAKQEVREAIHRAIDTRQLSNQVYGGNAKAATGQFLSYSTVFDPESRQPDFDPDKANQLLDAAGYPRKADGTRFTLRYSAWSTQIFGGPELGAVIKEQLSKVGIAVDLRVQDFSLFNEQVIKKHDFDLTGSGGLQGPYPSKVIDFVGTGGSRNVMGYSNPTVDALFADAARQTDVAKQKEDYVRIQQELARDLPRMNLVEYVDWQSFAKSATGFWWQDRPGRPDLARDMYNLVTMGG